MLKNGVVSEDANNTAAERMKDMVEYMKTDEYMKKREGKPAPEKKEAVYIKSQATVGSRREEVDIVEDDDFELSQIRERRLAAMKAKAQKANELKKTGHGMYREIDEKDFLPEVTSTQFVACHFYHEKFARCHYMHDKLGELSNRVVQIKFVKINAEEAPFFTDKLTVSVLPCIILFKDGVAVDRIQGFETLTYGDEFPLSRLEKRLCKVLPLVLPSLLLAQPPSRTHTHTHTPSPSLPRPQKFGVDMSSDGLDEDAQDDWNM